MKNKETALILLTSLREAIIQAQISNQETMDSIETLKEFNASIPADTLDHLFNPPSFIEWDAWVGRLMKIINQ